MKIASKPLLLSALLATYAAISQGQQAPAPSTSPKAEALEHMRVHMQAHRAERAADLKAKLKLAPEQEGAWTTFIAAMKPPTNFQRPQRGEMDKLTTPERLDRMRDLHKQRDAMLEQRESAVRTYYASLTTEQKVIFDANTKRPFEGHGGRMGHMGYTGQHGGSVPAAR